MNVKCSLKPDADGFLSQECPHCNKRFKVRFGKGSKKPLSYCPYCGTNGHHGWWTAVQMQHMDLVASKKRGTTPVEGDGPNEFARSKCCGEQFKYAGSTEKLYCPICGQPCGQRSRKKRRVAKKGPS